MKPLAEVEIAVVVMNIGIMPWISLQMLVVEVEVMEAMEVMQVQLEAFHSFHGK